MTKGELLEQLKLFTEASVKDLILPVRLQKEDSEPPKPRAAEVYKMRLTKGDSAKKVAPYIIHQLITGKDSQPAGQRPTGQAVIRSIFCVYDEDEQTGALNLLNLIERLRIELFKQVIVGNQFQLDLEQGIEYLIYPDDTAPYYAAEMFSTWVIPTPEREVSFYG